jgi:hypothetical protein
MRYRYAGLVQAGKYSAVVVDSTVYAKDGFNLPPGMNAPDVLGILLTAIVPDSWTGYNKGMYEGASQNPWPPNVNPASPQGRYFFVMRGGTVRARAALPWNRGDPLIIANNLGQLASPAALQLPSGTVVNLVGYAEEETEEPGDVADIVVCPSIATV